MAYRYAESDLFVVELEQGWVRARVWHEPGLTRTETSRLHQALQRALCRLARSDPEVASALILDLGNSDVVGQARLRAAFATVLQSWEIAHRPVAVVQQGAGVHLNRIAATVAPKNCRLVETQPDAKAWIDIAMALRSLPAPGMVGAY